MALSSYSGDSHYGRGLRKELACKRDVVLHEHIDWLALAADLFCRPSFHASGC